MPDFPQLPQSAQRIAAHPHPDNLKKTVLEQIRSAVREIWAETLVLSLGGIAALIRIWIKRKLKRIEEEGSEDPKEPGEDLR